MYIGQIGGAVRAISRRGCFVDEVVGVAAFMAFCGFEKHRTRAGGHRNRLSGLIGLSV